MTTLLAFLLALAILIVVHEWGHYRVARAFDVKVLRFSIGFGRVLWRRQRGDTEFVLSALPLGGYVRMLDEGEGPVAPDEQHRAFNRKPLLQRSAIVAAGPAANLVLAVLLYASTLWIGVQEPKAVLSTPAAASVAEQAGLRAGDWVRRWQAADAGGDTWHALESMNELRWQAVQHALEGRALTLETTDAQGRGLRRSTLALHTLNAADADAALLRRIGIGAAMSEARIGEVKSGGAAQQAGLQRGDHVLAIDGRPVADAQALREAIRASVAQGDGAAAADAVPAQTWRIDRSGRTLDIEVRPRTVWDAGRRVGRIEAEVGAPPAMVEVRAGLFEGLQRGAVRTWEVSLLSLRMLGRMLVGEASMKNLSGPLTIADHAGQSAAMGLVSYLGFLAMVSVSLGVLNLLPLPMLDGGHLMYHLFEGLTGRPVSDAWLARLQRGGIAILLLMMSVALFNDVARLLGLH